MRFLFFLLVFVAGYFAWQRYQQAVQPDDDPEPHEGDCRRVKLTATALPHSSGDRDWDVNSPPDLLFQVQSQVTEVCHDSLTCEHTINLRVPSRRFEMQLLDRDEENNEVVASGWVSVDTHNSPLGRATISVRCLEWVDE